MATSSKSSKQTAPSSSEPADNPHEWTDSSDDDDNDDIHNEFFDAQDTVASQNPTSSTSKDSEADLLHNRLNAQLSTNDTLPEKSPEDPYFIDEELIMQREALLTEEEKEERSKQSQLVKDEGNSLFKRGEYNEALEKYSEALSLCSIKYARDRSIIYANRAACLMKMEKYEAAIQSCTISLQLDPTYVKSLMRRAESYKAIDKLDEALQDYQKIVELDPANAQARQEVYTLPEKIKERNEKLKEEMLGKLKDLGNMILRPFGLSTDNFKLQQDPSTGSYSVNFQK